MTLSPNASSQPFVLMMDVLVGIVGFALSTVWWTQEVDASAPKRKSILITGGASGIGLELARRLLQDGNQVAICGRDRDRLEAANRSVPQLQTIVADIRNEEDRQ